MRNPKPRPPFLPPPRSVRASLPLRAGFSLASAGCILFANPTEPRAEARRWGVDVAVRAGFHFGGGRLGRLGVGVEGRVLNQQGYPPDWSTRIGLGLRVGMVGPSQLALSLGPYLGFLRRDTAVGFEGGVGYRLLDDRGRFLHGGLAGELARVQLRAGYASGADYSLGAGAVIRTAGWIPERPIVGTVIEGGPGGAPMSVPGRPVRDANGFAVLPAAFVVGDAHRPANNQDDQDAQYDHDRNRAHRIWLERARAEWSSVAAFWDLAEQLRTCGAPAPFIARAYAAADDEVAHAAIAAAISASLIGCPVELAPPLPSPRSTLKGAAALRRLAVESWVDGCLNEGIAAALANAESNVADDDRLVAGLRQIACDEQRHADLAWDVLAWASHANPADTTKTLLDLIRGTPPTPPTLPTSTSAQDGLARFGCLSTAAAAPIIATTHQTARARLTSLLHS